MKTGERQEKACQDILILGIESSCDETAASLVRNGREVLSNVISSQIDIHTLYGGVVPEIASRKHIERISQVVSQALKDAGKSYGDLSAIGVTYGPGLVGPLLIGVSYAKAACFAAGLPLIGVNHIEGHIAANYIEHPDLRPPFLCLVVSGGHTHLVRVLSYGKYEILGRTQDDAAGEAFDKVARAIGLGYPGGPKIDAAAREGNPDAIRFPRAHVADHEYDFSFSGLKSAVLNYLNSEKMKRHAAENAGRTNSETGSKGDVTEAGRGEEIPPIDIHDIAASFQKAVVDVLVENSMKAADRTGDRVLALAGGVASNSALRQALEKACTERGIAFYRPSPVYCTDNAAMIGSAAYYAFIRGERSALDLNAIPGLRLGE
ncbi:MAG: tRNA (adenosine(37)-N6)-threonylcarbamoyltransferase complex transferase subunit TsaD [Lachnospiraceae bacterium]|nr:tRNA (adenosine(37)-N6)-threonylcarbamoyltransferase complex transferase subunit TsaD [Lachnospiraceae bacterium]